MWSGQWYFVLLFLGTLLLAVMGLFSYVFVTRALQHKHEVEVTSLKAPPNDASGSRTGRTMLVQNHRHQVTIDADGNGSTDISQGHYHEINARTVGDRNRRCRRARGGA